jgi:hypothetical protein
MISPRYRRSEVDVLIDGNRVRAYTYVGKKTANVPPDKSCVERVIKGARTQGLPEDYIKKLERLLQNC